MMNKKEITAFAKKQGYDGVLPLGKWKDYECYEPFFENATDEEPAEVGPPLIVLVKGDEIRMSTVDEAYEQMEDSEE